MFFNRFTLAQRAPTTSQISRRPSPIRLRLAGVMTALAIGGSLAVGPAAQAVTADNAKPIAKISLSIPRPPLTVGTVLTMNGSGSSDPEGQPLTYTWIIEPSPENTDIDADPFWSGTGPKVDHQFGSNGLYTVSLVVEDVAGGRSATSVEVEIVGPNTRAPMPIVSWTSEARFVEPGTPVRVYADARDDQPDDELTFEWYFTEDRGKTWTPGETGPSATHRFKTVGYHGIKVVVTDPYGAVGTDFSDVNVVAPAPVASFTRSPSSSTLKPGTAVTFDAGASTGDGLKYSWKVNGDASLPGADAATFRHTFSTVGRQRVELTVTDAKGRTDSQTADITVEAAPVERPVARFTQTPNSPTIAANTEVTFDGSASTGTGLKYAWYVRGEEGVVSTEKVLTHTFKTPGDYGVELRVTDTAKQTARKWTGLKVTGTTERPVATFTQTPSSPTVAANTEVTFDGSASTGTGLKYAWYVRGEDGVVSTEKVLNHTFKNAGKYGVELRVTDALNHTAKKWTELTVTGTNNPPIANFNQTPNSPVIKAGTAITFDGSTSSDPDGDQLKYYWFVRGQKGVVSTNRVLNHTFKTAGDYGVELRVVDPTGAISKKWVGLTVTN